MKAKKLTKKDYIFFTLFVIFSISGILYVKLVVQDNPIYHPKPLTDSDITTYGNNDSRTVVIYPIFTQFAYKPGGFYDYYKGKCGTCTIVSMRPFGIHPIYNTGGNSFEYLEKLNYEFITDITVDKHPEILKDYDKIILLHNEYMTQKEFDAIRSHNNVIYLYPNAMYGLISVNYSNWTITLLKGHGYPTNKIQNGFNYVTSSQFEYDTNCKDYKWQVMPNGMLLSCFPEYLVTYDRNLLQTIKEYPQVIPPLTNETYADYNNLRFCDRFGNCTQTLDEALKSNP